MSEAVQKPWLKTYPENVPHEIDQSKVASIADVMESTCKSFAGRTAFYCLGSKISFSRWNKDADALAAYLAKELGVKQGDRVGIMLPNLIQFPVSMLAVQKLGAIAVCTNPLYTEREMEHQFADADISVLIITDLFLDKLEAILSKTNIKDIVSVSVGDYMPFWKKPIVSTVMKLKGQIPAHSLKVIPFCNALKTGRTSSYTRAAVDPDSTAILQYTGGTTGVAKGAMLTHRNIVSNAMQIEAWVKNQLKRGDKEVVLAALPLYHIFSLTVSLMSLASLGLPLALVPKPMPILTTIKVLKKYGVTIYLGVNTLYKAFNENNEFKAYAPKNIKFAIAGGMALQTIVVEQFRKITGSEIVEGYGLTEASPVTHLNPLYKGGARKGSIGVPLCSTEAAVLSESGEFLEAREVGELCIRGPQVMKGYWKRPDETAKTMHGDWLKTGDIVKMDEEGYFYIVDRKKDLVIVSGFNVYPNEIENHFCLHPKVKEAAVVGIPDAKSGEAVVAFIVKKDPSLTEDDLRAFAKENFTAYKRPRHYRFKNEMPKTNVGKILRRKLREELVSDANVEPLVAKS